MNLCDHCSIDDKIYECCGRHPETGEADVLLISQNQRWTVCPNLKESGKCSARPFVCQAHYCILYQGINGMAAGFLAMREKYEMIR